MCPRAVVPYPRMDLAAALVLRRAGRSRTRGLALFDANDQVQFASKEIVNHIDLFNLVIRYEKSRHSLGLISHSENLLVRLKKTLSDNQFAAWKEA